MLLHEQHDKNISRIAVVGDEKWRDLMYAYSTKGFAKPRLNISFLTSLQKRARGCRRHNPWPLLA